MKNTMNTDIDFDFQKEIQKETIRITKERAKIIDTYLKNLWVTKENYKYFHIKSHNNPFSWMETIQVYKKIWEISISLKNPIE